MVEPLVVLLIVVAIDASDPTFPALPAFRDAVADASRGEAHVVVEERAALPSDDEAIALGRSSHARVVTELRWDPDRARATVRIHAERSTAWVDRAITFRRNDAPSERGRAIGVVVAALLPELERDGDAVAPAETRTPNDAENAHAHAVVSKTPFAAEPAASSSTRAVASIGASGVGFIGLGGPAPAIGAAIDARWYVLPRFGLRFVGGLRAGSVDAAQATARTFTIGGGASLTVAGGERSRFELAIRSDIVASSLQIDRRSARTGLHDGQARWLPAVDAAIEAFWNLTPSVAVSLSVGGEATLGTTAVVVDGRSAASMAVFSPFTDAGLRFRF